MIDKNRERNIWETNNWYSNFNFLALLITVSFIIILAVVAFHWLGDGFMNPLLDFTKNF